MYVKHWAAQQETFGNCRCILTKAFHIANVKYHLSN